MIINLKAQITMDFPHAKDDFNLTHNLPQRRRIIAFQ